MSSVPECPCSKLGRGFLKEFPGFLLIRQRSDLLLFYLIIGEVLLVFLPARARGAGHIWM